MTFSMMQIRQQSSKRQWKPQNGEKKILYPACGSGGMFVQEARFMHRHNNKENEVMKFRCYGVEKELDTEKLAKWKV